MAGVTLVELTLVLCVSGIVLAVFVPAFVGALRTSRVSEAVEHLDEMYRRTAAYFQAKHEVRPASAGGSRRCLPVSAGPLPRTPTAQQQSIDWDDDALPGYSTWRAIGFHPGERLRYSYELISSRSGCGLSAVATEKLVAFRARGDLDGDGQMSTVERYAGIARDGSLQPVGILYVHDRVE